ncbi:hypothetical protein KDW_28820 [Dictyobacter vulcani]|uniref:Uncharacterized protein n=1 Tax=Dictyobacter vulcani TaxID=2607529 RepID=A0A5J4KQL1_9CHLR|nr:hypothetical protein [Dictyobacter vulcani]GER88720.1 hypothetical protein KDW_28820 [Dictyobacter vulcani]
MYISAQRLRHMQQVQDLLDQLQPTASAEVICVPGSQEPEGTVIVFTGSFNPPTIAHLALLKQAQQYAKDVQGPVHVYAAFSKRTVDKEGVERPLLLDKVILLQDILSKRLPAVGILLFNRGLYVEQAQAIRQAFPKVKRVLFLMGFDKIVQIFDPHYYEDRDASLEALFSMAELFVVPRGNAGEDDLARLLQQPENQRFACYVTSRPFAAAYRDISATQVRQGGSHYEHETPREVRYFIQRLRPYAPPVKRLDGSERDVYQEHVAYVKQHLGPVC